MKNDAVRTQRSAATDRRLSAVTPVRANVTIAGVGAYLPAARLSSDEVQARIAEASGLVLPDGLVERITGITTRPLMADDEQCSTLAAAACQDLFARTGVDPDSIDLLIFASASRDMVEPATSHAVQDLLGTRAHCFDVTNACNSLLNAIDVASAMLAAGRASRALVCAGEAPSRGVRWDIADLDSLVDHFAGFTFGDAGSAVLLTRADDPVIGGGDCPGAGITYFDAVAHSEHWKVGGLFGGGSRHPRDPEWTYFRGDGRHLLAAFEEAGDAMLRRTLETTGTHLRRLPPHPRPPGHPELRREVLRHHGRPRRPARADRRAVRQHGGRHAGRAAGRGLRHAQRPATGSCSSAWAVASPWRPWCGSGDCGAARRAARGRGPPRRPLPTPKPRTSLAPPTSPAPRHTRRCGSSSRATTRRLRITGHPRRTGRPARPSPHRPGRRQRLHRRHRRGRRRLGQARRSGRPALCRDRRGPAVRGTEGRRGRRRHRLPRRDRRRCHAPAPHRRRHAARSDLGADRGRRPRPCRRRPSRLGHGHRRQPRPTRPGRPPLARALPRGVLGRGGVRGGPPRAPPALTHRTAPIPDDRGAQHGRPP